ncbi:hypothetical protein P886_0861 [Alteromonadaceae bacterium 2753L.S.0a.02]|nr:hypothetical protein P886_0861 [Alteromonadaceae bacterium 2753L.S.0a.02]
MKTLDGAKKTNRSLLFFNLEPVFALVIPVIFGATYLQMAALQII